jgi:hypothetical protein
MALGSTGIGAGRGQRGDKHRATGWRESPAGTLKTPDRYRSLVSGRLSESFPIANGRRAALDCGPPAPWPVYVLVRLF